MNRRVSFRGLQRVERAYLESVEEDVETGGDVDCTRAGVGVERVDDTEERAEEAVGDSSLGRKRAVVEDGSSSGLKQGCGQQQTVGTERRYAPRIRFQQSWEQR